MQNIRQLEETVKSIRIVDSFGPDYKLTSKEFEKVKSDNTLLKTLIGDSPLDLSWETFKEKFISYQLMLGWKWIRTMGQFGTLTLESVTLNPEIGEEIATSMILEKNKKNKSGYFTPILERYLPEVTKYLNTPGFDLKKLDITLAKNRFSETTIENQRYKFTTKSLYFELGIEQYTYVTDNKRSAEYDLGENILELIGNKLKLDSIKHKQEKRKYGIHQNADFEGYSIIKGLKGDDIEVINIELKPSNKIESVSEAISQAVNYKERANRTYIAIPLFDPKSFYDNDRYGNFISLCKENDLGIISIAIEVETHKINDVDIILQAPKRDISNFSTLNDLLHLDQKGFCKLCQKIVSNDENQRVSDCGWLVVKAQGEPGCMKILFEKKVAE